MDYENKIGWETPRLRECGSLDETENHIQENSQLKRTDQTAMCIAIRKWHV